MHTAFSTGIENRETGATNSTNQNAGILCLSHLGWDYVWQRPQHILSRLARHYPVLYVCEPEIVQEADEAAWLEAVGDEQNVQAWQPYFADRRPVYDNWRGLYTELIQNTLLQAGWVQRRRGKLSAARPLVYWFYTPLPYYVLDGLPRGVVVYDVMDDLASFKGAADDLPQRETKLLRQTDVVFTGGHSLYQSRQERHHNVHLYASGVETGHFARAREPETPIAPKLADLPRPILGYFGAIDERIDHDLLRAVARRHPEWSLVMIGPVVKVKKADLARAPNIHYLGLQPYERLPSFLKAFDLCLMPFALNEATRSISPTKTLEYMAAHKPIISTPIPDVRKNWGDVVIIGAGAEQFISAAERALQETSHERVRRQQREKAHLARSSWERIVSQMQQHLEAALDGHSEPRSGSPNGPQNQPKTQ